MTLGCAGLLTSGRHADLSFELPARKLRAHRCILEARCGAPFVQALEAGALGTATLEAGLLRVTCTVEVLGAPSGQSLAALLKYMYTEKFEPESLTGHGGAVALLRLVRRCEASGSSPALERLRALCEKELAAAIVPETVVSNAHEAADLGASQLLRCVTHAQTPALERVRLARFPLVLHCLWKVCGEGLLSLHPCTACRRPRSYCLQSMVLDFQKLAASGQLTTLRTELAASLLLMRTAAPIQDALIHNRADVAEFILTKPPAGLSAVLSALDDLGRTPLEVALSLDDLTNAKLLLSKGADVNAMASGGDAPLIHSACYAGALHDPRKSDLSIQKMSLLLEYKAAVDAMNKRGESALDVALFNGGPSVVGLLLRNHAKSKMSTSEGGCLLHAAATLGRADVLETALGCLSVIGVNLNQQDKNRDTPLHIAVSKGDAALVAPLLKSKANTELQNEDGSTPLGIAVRQGDLPLTSLLLDAGADRNAEWIRGADVTPLIVLAAEMSNEVTKALVNAGADLNRADSVGRTALEIAVFRRELELAELLVRKGAKPTTRKDPNGNTSLHVAVTNQDEGLVRLLVTHRAELSEQNRQGQTPLIIGAETGQEGVVELLLHSGAPLHLCDASNRSALERALENGHLKVLQILLQQSIVDVNGITKRGSSLLHLAAELGDEMRVTFLLSMSAQVDVLNPNGETPLHWACSLGHLAAVRALVQYGANTMLHEKVQGLTPLHAACGSRGNPAVLALLIQRCEMMGWHNQPQKCNLLDANKNTPLHTSAKLARHALKYVPILLEHGANPSLQNGKGQTVLHLLAERAVREMQEISAVQGGSPRIGGLAEDAAAAAFDADDADGEPAGPLQVTRLVSLLAEIPNKDLVALLDAQETETGNTALHIAAFGGCVPLAVQLVGLCASVALPNKDGFSPLDSSFRDPDDPTQSLSTLLLTKITKPASWTPDKMCNACQICKLPFNKTDPKRARKHHCRHCGRCVCSECTPKKMAIPKFGSNAQERVCLVCERVLQIRPREGSVSSN